MQIFNSKTDLRVVVRTTQHNVIDTSALEIELEDVAGRFTLRADEPALTALVPHTMIIRRRDGSEIHVDVGYGSLTAVSGQARIVVNECAVSHVESLRIAG